MPAARNTDATSRGIYVRHRPEQTLLYQLVECHYPEFNRLMAALVPQPRVNLTRFHGIFAPNSKYRVTITPAVSGPAVVARTGSWTDRLRHTHQITDDATQGIAGQRPT